MEECNDSVTVVIVTYHSKDIIANALAGLKRHDGNGYVKTIVVDNASADGIEKFLKRKHPWLKLICNPVNIGFGRGCNIGFRHVKTPYVLFLNPDAMLEYGELKVLVSFMNDHPNVAVAAPAIIEEEGHLQTAGRMPTPLSIIKAALGHRKPLPGMRQITPRTQPFRTNWVCGAVMLIRSEIFRKIGGFDPRYFLYFEETDLFRRAMKAGGEIWAVGEAVAIHKGGMSAKTTGQPLESLCIAEHFYRSRFYYLVKHFGFLPAVGVELFSRMIQVIRYAKNNALGQKTSAQSPIEYPFLRYPAKV